MTDNNDAMYKHILKLMEGVEWEDPDVYYARQRKERQDANDAKVTREFAAIYAAGWRGALVAPTVTERHEAETGYTKIRFEAGEWSFEMTITRHIDREWAHNQAYREAVRDFDRYFASLLRERVKQS